METNKFWDFIPGTETSPPEMLLYGPISSRQSWWEDQVTPQQFNKELAALGDVPEIVVRINSGGGDVFAANAIFTRLKDHTARITVKIDGWAASAATIIAMAGDVIKIARNGVFMIHDPAMTVWDTFRAEDFEKMAGELKVIKQSIVNTYAMKTGMGADDIASLMSEEKWWTGDEAVENGFCDELMFEEADMVVENSSNIVVNSTHIDISAFKTVPKTLLNSLKNAGSLTGAAEGKGQEEEKRMEAGKSIKTVDELKAAYPDLVSDIQNEAAASERNRIKAIEDMAGGNYADLVSDAKFTHPCTAEQVAVKIVAEQNKQGKRWLEDRAKDAEESGANGVAGAAGGKGTEGESPYDAAIDALKFD
ncbi:MAG: Clp protease ClpP [Lachnospiraceae bacterium]|nr:Clp protease ClpP [Lachnospiraceae bacterium]